LRLHIPVVAVVMLESGGKLCALCGECCLTGFSSGGFVGGVNGQLNKRVVLPRVLFRNELPFFVEGLYGEKFVCGS